MKNPLPAPSRLPFLTPMLAAFALASLPAQASPLERKILERVLHGVGKEALEKSAKETLEHSVSAAIRTLGHEGAEQVIERGGLALLHAGVQHGDDIWKLAARVPETAHYLAAKPAHALALARELGENAVRLEARAPGMAQKAALHFGPKSLEPLAKAAPGEATHLIGYAEKAANPEVRKKLFDLWLKRGAGILTALDRHKGLILTAGLTLATLDLAHGVSNGLEEAIPQMPAAMKDTTETLARQSGPALQWGAILLGAGAGGSLLIASYLRNRKSTPPGASRP
jgi:hypothetical protein